MKYLGYLRNQLNYKGRSLNLEDFNNIFFRCSELDFFNNILDVTCFNVDILLNI